MAWKLYRRNVVQYLDESFRAKHKIVQASTFYVFDDERHVRCCELTPSFELWPVSHDAEIAIDDDEPAREAAWEAFDEACRGDDDVIYVHVFDTAKSPNVRPAFAPDAKTFDDLDSGNAKGVDPCDEKAVREAVYRQQADELIEYYAGNCPCW